MFSCYRDFHSEVPILPEICMSFVISLCGTTLAGTSWGSHVSLNFENVIVSYF